MNPNSNRYRIAVYLIIACVALILALIALNYASNTAQAILINLSTELFGVFIIYFLVNRFFELGEQDYIKKLDQIANDIKVQTERLEQQAMQAELAPIAYFPSTDKTIPRFANLHSNSFSRTKLYRYKGDKGLFLSYRLHNMVNFQPSLKIEIVLPNPVNESISIQRATTIKNSARYKGISIQKIVEERKIDLLATIISVYDLKENVDCDLYLDNELPFIRYEIFDDIVIVSFLPMQQFGYYPATLIYNHLSPFYTTFNVHFNQLTKLSQKLISTSSSVLEEDTIKQLIQDSKVPKTIDELRDHYRIYHQALASQ